MKSKFWQSCQHRKESDFVWIVVTCILPCIRLSADVKISCFVLWLFGEVRITFPAPELSDVVRMNCCLGALEGFMAVTIWIFGLLCRSVTIWGRRVTVWQTYCTVAQANTGKDTNTGGGRYHTGVCRDVARASLDTIWKHLGDWLIAESVGNNNTLQFEKRFMDLHQAPQTNTTNTLPCMVLLTEEPVSESAQNRTNVSNTK